MGNKLFRQQAMDMLESPDRVSDYIRVTGPSFHLWLISILVCVISASIWVLNSTISDTVKISGIAFPHNEIMQAAPPIEGRITEVFIRKGNSVKRGDILFRYTCDNLHYEMRSPYSGVVLSHKWAQDTFSAMEPCVYLLPDNQVNQLKEVMAFVTYSDLRKLKVGMAVQATPTGLKREEIGYMYGKITGIDDLPTSVKEAENLLKLEGFKSAVYPEQSSFLVKIKLQENPQKKGNIHWSHPKGEDIQIKIGTICDLQIVTGTRSVFDLLFNRNKN